MTSKHKKEVESRNYYDKLAGEYHYAESYRRWPWVEYFHLERRIGSVAAAVNEIARSRPIREAIDVGCGDGILLPLLSARAENVLATDISPERLEMARKTAGGLDNVRFEEMDIMEGCSRHCEAFDLVVTSEVIEHVSRPDLFFERLVEMVAPGGSLVLTTPSRWSVREKTLRLQQMALNFYYNIILKRDVHRFRFFHVGLLSITQLKRLAQKHFTRWELQSAGLYIPLLTELGFAVGGERWRRWYKSVDERVGKSPAAWLNWTQLLIAYK